MNHDQARLLVRKGVKLAVLAICCHQTAHQQAIVTIFDEGPSLRHRLAAHNGVSATSVQWRDGARTITKLREIGGSGCCLVVS